MLLIWDFAGGNGTEKENFSTLMATAGERSFGPTPVGAREYLETLTPLLEVSESQFSKVDYKQARAYYLFMNYVFMDEDVSEKIRTEQASMMASKVSAIPAVRAYLLDTQRDFAKTDNVLMDGRDIGTVVLPNASVKIFLTASPEIRAKRRVKQLEEKGIKCDYDEVLKDIITRDYNDSHREIAPLKPAENAIILDTSDMTLEESIDALVKLVEERV